MKQYLRFKKLTDLGSERSDFVRRTRTICVYSDDRPEIASKSLVKVTVTSKCKNVVVDGVFCVDALGSKKGSFVGHPSHFQGLNDGDEITLTITPATANECVAWLESNDDPERKAFALILKNALQVSEETRNISKLAHETFETTKLNLDKAEQLSEIARRDKENSDKNRKLGIVYGAVGFILGALLDLGMLEEKFGFTIPTQGIGALFLVAVAVLIIGPKIVNR